MMRVPCFLLLLLSAFQLSFVGDNGPLVSEKGPGSQAGRFFSAVNGKASEPDTIVWTGKKSAAISAFELAGTDKDEFIIVSSIPGESGETGGSRVVVVFKPAKGNICIARARLRALNAKGKTVREIALTGLSAKGLEGENEPPLSRVFEALGYRVDLGWTSLANHCRPEMQGDEIPAGIFKKAGKGLVKMTALARYSPDFRLPFGYYTNGKEGAVTHPLGALAQAGPFPEHQALFPRVEEIRSFEGTPSFDPGSGTFGFYVAGPDHAAYTEDSWNMICHTRNVGHATRVYQARDRNGKAIKNAYFICFEEASNGDYNDYVFLVENIAPVPSAFTALFNGKNLEGWDLYLEDTGNTDPEHNFRVEDGTLHVNGRQVGYVITENAYTNYHFKVDFKWGEKRWPPRENTKRDAGVCYHIAIDAPDKVWQKSIECQIQEGDVGDFWLLGKTTIEVDGKPNEPQDYGRIPKKKDAENPTGRWNTLEILSFDGKCIHVLNGEVVNYGENASVSSGRILLQSEYAEIYYRNVMIRPLDGTQ